MRSRITNERGDSSLDPAGGIIWLMLEELGQDGNGFLVVSDVDDPVTTYMLAARQDDNAYHVEFQVRRPEIDRREANGLSLDQAHQALVRFSFGDY